METYQWHEKAIGATDNVSLNKKDNEIFIEESN